MVYTEFPTNCLLIAVSFRSVGDRCTSSLCIVAHHLLHYRYEILLMIYADLNLEIKNYAKKCVNNDVCIHFISFQSYFLFSDIIFTKINRVRSCFFQTNFILEEAREVLRTIQYLFMQMCLQCLRSFSCLQSIKHILEYNGMPHKPCKSLFSLPHISLS